MNPLQASDPFLLFCFQ